MDRLSELSSRQQISFDFIPTRFTTKVVVSTCVLILCGALNTILFKEQTASFGLADTYISVQVLIIFAGQYINLIIFYLRILVFRRNILAHFQKYKNRSLLSGRMFHYRSINMGIAAFINCFASTMQLYALVTLSPSLFQMLTGFGVVFTPLISRVVLRRRVYPHTAAGIALSMLGLAAILVSAFYFEGAERQGTEHWLKSMVIMLGGVFLASLQRVYEEWLLDRIETSTYRFIGYEGYFGIIFLFFFHAAFWGVNREFGVEVFNIGKELALVARDRLLLVTSAVLLASCTAYELSGVILTKKVSATYRVVNETARVVLVWIAQIFIYDLFDPALDNFRYGMLTLCKLLGYGLLILGNVLINEIVEVNFLGLNRYYGRYQNAKFEDNLADESDEYSIMKS